MTSLALDFALLCVIAVNAWLGTRRGLVLGVLDLIGWMAAFVLAQWAAVPLGNELARATHIPRGIAGLAVVLGVLALVMMAATAVSWFLYRRLIAPRMLGSAERADRYFGLIPGAIDGLILASLVLALLLSTSINGAVNRAVIDSRLARPIALAAVQASEPFEQAAQEAALDLNGFITKYFGEPSTRLTLPVTAITPDPAAEQQMLSLVNAERTQRGLVPLVVDAKLTEVARQHSTEMLQQHYFAHDSPELGSPFDRMAQAGIRYRLAGENLALAPNVERAHSGLMNSPEHRDNILRPEFRKIGIGAVSGGLSGIMFTQDFTD